VGAGTLLVIFKNSVNTAKKTQFTITNINWLMLFKEIIVVYSENRTKLMNTFSGKKKKNADLLIIKAGGTYIYR
jgi:hypothetical protein